MAQTRFTMTMFIRELNSFTLREETPIAIAEFRTAVNDTEKRLREWYDDWPNGLQYSKILPSGLFEMQ